MKWRRTDQVSPELAAAVFDRDREMVADHFADQGVATAWRRDRLVISQPAEADTVVALAREVMWERVYQPFVVCPAVVINDDEFGNCWGRWRIEHVKKQPRFAKRAEPEMARLMALCQGHTEDGMKAGRIWATAHRDEQREYLAKVNP